MSKNDDADKDFPVTLKFPPQAKFEPVTFNSCSSFFWLMIIFHNFPPFSPCLISLDYYNNTILHYIHFVFFQCKFLDSNHFRFNSVRFELPRVLAFWLITYEDLIFTGANHFSRNTGKECHPETHGALGTLEMEKNLSAVSHSTCGIFPPLWEI